MLLKALLWNRVVCLKSKGDLIPFSFLCDDDLTGTKKADDDALAYFVLVYLIPSEMMFDVDYWRWRIFENPSEYEIFQRHFDYFCDSLNLDKDVILNSDEKIRFKHILKMRGCDEELISEVTQKSADENLNYDVLSSRLDISEKQIYRINSYTGDEVRSKFNFSTENDSESIKFYPFVDIGGSAAISRIIVDDKIFEENAGFEYYPKSKPFKEFRNINLSKGKHKIEIVWKYDLSGRVQR